MSIKDKTSRGNIVENLMIVVDKYCTQEDRFLRERLYSTVSTSVYHKTERRKAKLW
jgi:hypothetical protein